MHVSPIFFKHSCMIVKTTIDRAVVFFIFNINFKEGDITKEAQTGEGECEGAKDCQMSVAYTMNFPFGSLPNSINAKSF